MIMMNYMSIIKSFGGQFTAINTNIFIKYMFKNGIKYAQEISEYVENLLCFAYFRFSKLSLFINKFIKHTIYCKNVHNHM